MINNRNLFQVPNQNSCDSKLRDLIYTIDENLITFLRENLKKDDYLCVCSGGTTSSCAKDNLYTLDLRKNYSQISFDNKNQHVTLGGGVNMGNLSKYLDKFERFFPIGLSQLPGLGYILTGGVSPLSRRYGLAVDNIISMKGYFANGEKFSLNKYHLNAAEYKIWNCLKGAAPFFSIVTEIKLKTFRSYPILVFEGSVKEDELAELIIKSENFPKNASLQWIFADKIYFYILIELRTNEDKSFADKFSLNLKKYSSLKITKYKSLNSIKFFPKELNLFEFNSNNHSEVMSLLGKNLGNKVFSFIKILKEINLSKPNKACYVASQQLGCFSQDNKNSFFIHRECIWKPWIFASWEKNNLKEREIAINWIYKSWGKMKVFYPKIHLAQLHNHLTSHAEEIQLAFGEKISFLKDLKNFYDPSRILPPL